MFVLLLLAFAAFSVGTPQKGFVQSSLVQMIKERASQRAALLNEMRQHYAEKKQKQSHHYVHPASRIVHPPQRVVQQHQSVVQQHKVAVQHQPKILHAPKFLHKKGRL